MRYALHILFLLLVPSAFAQRLISVATDTNGVISVPYTFWPSNAASAWSAWGMTNAGIPYHLGSGRFMPLTIGSGLSTNGWVLSATNGGVANITTNGSSAGNPVTLQPDLSLATTNVLTVSTQNVDVLVLTEPLSIANGGTGTNSAAAALANLGGQPLDADLTLLSAIGLSTNGWTQGQVLAFQANGSLAPTNVVSGTNSGSSGFGPVDYLDFAKPGGGWVRVSFDDLNEMDLSEGDGGAAGGSSVSWTNLVDVPAGFADGTDDGGAGSSWTNLTDIPSAISALSTNNGASLTNLNGSNIASGTVADARIDAAIARDAEMALLYQPTNANLTTLATLNGSALTNLNASELRSGTVGTARLGSGTANSTTFLRGDGSWASPTASADGTTNAAMTITNLTTENITYRGRRQFNPMNGDIWYECVGGNSASSGSSFSPYFGTTISSGTATPATGTTHHQGITVIASSSSANSGYYLANQGLSAFLLSGNELNTKIFSLAHTNAAVYRMGFLDIFGITEPTDGTYLEIQNGYIYGRTANNTSRTSTTTSNQVALSTWYTGEIELNSDASQAVFRLYNDSGTLLWSATNSANIPTATGRELAEGLVAYFTTGGATNLLNLDASGVQFLRKLTRYP